MTRQKNKGTGRMLYVPKPVIKELDFIMQGKDMKKSNAFVKMAKFSEVGRAADRVHQVLFGRRRRK